VIRHQQDVIEHLVEKNLVDATASARAASGPGPARRIRATVRGSGAAHTAHLVRAGPVRWSGAGGPPVDQEGRAGTGFGREAIGVCSCDKVRPGAVRARAYSRRHRPRAGGVGGSREARVPKPPSWPSLGNPT
jgi:hypothetical protein